MKIVKQTVGILLMAALSFTAFEGCKKGENDPGLSLKSRKGRLSKEWKLTKIDITETKTTSTGQTSTATTYDGATYTESKTGNGIPSPIVVSFPFSLELTFDKNGTYEKKEIANSVLTTTKGYWTFSSKNKEAELKKKEAVMLNITAQSSTGYSDTYSDADIDETFLLDKLSGKELIVLIDETSSGTGTSVTKKGTYTFEKK